MYFIQGADQKEYGPITAEQLRQWISESRLNRASLARSDADPAWKPLSQFPEFADAFGIVVPGPAPAGYAPAYAPASSPVFDNAEAEALVRPPAIALISFSGLMLFLCLLGLAGGPTFFGVNQQQPLPAGTPEFFGRMMEIAKTMQQPGVFYVQTAFSLAYFTIMLVGAIKMIKLRSRGLAMTAAILAIIPCLESCCCVLGIPFGIWALVVLNKPEVKDAFR
jgi:hypothetical protein